MYKTITLKGCSEPIQCDKGPVIFVGPNGAGKSILLKELAWEKDFQIIESSESKVLDEALYNRLKQALLVILGSENFLDNLTSIKNPHLLANTIFPRPFDLCRMDGKGRFSVFTEKEKIKNFWGEESISLHEKLFKDYALHKKLTALLLDAFRKYFILDAGNHPGMLTVKFAESEQDNKRALDQEMKPFYSSAIPLSQCSDGMQAYTAILATFIASDNLSAFFVDEPEAFLHPPLASLLGKQLSEVAAERDCNLFAATHSPDFLKGCIQSGKPVQIVRMERINDVSKIRSISADELRNLLQDPIIRSTNVLAGLFAEGVIVVEGDTDRVFYNEIYERLRAASKVPKLLPLFINGNGRSTVFKITKALRRFGVPAAAIVDFDVFGVNNWGNFLQSIFVDQGIGRTIKGIRTNMLNDIQGKENWKEGKDTENWKEGVTSLPPSQLQSFKKMDEMLAEHGLFVVPKGGLESWLSSLKIFSKKKDWLREILEEMGSDPNHPNYIQPDKGDVWGFIQNCVDWLANPDRNGMPKQSEANSTAPSPSVIKETSAAPSL